MLTNKSKKGLFALIDQFNTAALLFDEDLNLLHFNNEASGIINKSVSSQEETSDLISEILTLLSSEIKKRFLHKPDTKFLDFDFTDTASQKVFHIIINRLTNEDSIYFLCLITESSLDNPDSFYKKIFDSTNDIILLIDPLEFKIVEANSNAVKLYNTSLQELIGSNFIYLSRLPEKEIEILRDINFSDKQSEYETIHLKSNRDDLYLKARISKLSYLDRDLILFSATEITETQLTEQRLQSSENRFKILYDNNPLMTFIIDSDGIISSVNKSVKTELQYLTDELIGNHISKIYHPEDEQLINFQINQCIQNPNRTFTWELRLLNRFNSIVWVRVSAISFITKKGNNEVMIVCDNITVQKDTEKTLVDYAKSLQRMLDASPLGVLVYSLDKENNLRLITTNHSAETILGFRADDYLYKRIEEIFPSLPYNSIVLQFKEIAKNGGSYLFQKINYNDKNISGIYEYSAIQLAENTVAIFFTDITDREKSIERIAESEHKYKTLFEGSNDAILLMKNEYFIDANQKALELFGCSKEELINKTPIEFSPEIQEDDQPSKNKALNIIQEALNGSPQFFEWKHLKKDKTEFDAEVSLFLTEIKSEKFIQAIVRDITEKKKSQRQIAMFANAFRNISECVIIGDTQDNIIFVNDAFTRTYGYKQEEIIGKNVSLIRSSKNSPYLVQNILPQTLKGGWKGELINVKKSGEEFIISLSTSPIYDDKGNLIALTGIVEDITERKQTIQRLSESEERFRSLVNNLIESVIIVDWNGKILFANQSAAKLVELDSPEKGIGKSVTEFLHPSNIDKAIRLISFEKDSTETKRDNFQIVTATKKIRWVESMSTRIRYQNQELLLTTLRDITDRIKTEKMINLLTNALHSAANGVIITDRDGKIIWLNEAIEKLTGYKEEEMIGKTTSIFKSGLMPDEFYKKMWNTIESGKVWKGELINKRKDGTYYEEEMTITPIYDNENEISHFISIKQDITERKKIEREIREAKIKAEEINKLKSTFLANMSHELRTPLVGILGFAELLRDNITTPELAELASRIHTSGKRLLETLNSILDLSRIEANKMELKGDYINICRVVRENLLQFEAFAKTKNLYLKIDLEEDEIICFLDEKILHQILNNLINNAIKYTERGGVTVKVQKEIINNVSNVTIKIQDTGIGIPKESLSKIFEEFRQVSEGLDRKYEGTGLGLTLTKKFVEVLGGTITVESEIDKGSTFSISFPSIYDEKKIPERNSLEEVNPASEKVINSDQQLNILLVENDDASIEVTKLFLKDIGKLSVAKTGTEAIELLNNTKFDLILMDINLGRGSSGIEVTRQIRSMKGYENIPIVAVSAYAMVGDKEEFIKAGCTHYLSKPFKKNDLVGLINEIIYQKINS
ncbi:NarL family signal transduction histidine kinase [Ignavibacterium album JCM 16511]|uniref:histidine kinase n=1 Tax=Ignavibacterium album (strain DSM 19864 / JCM 16511 / NBRC 101810 / Mat9-16) TaxID=945713 RepID=I0ALU1_IGNAJ|nr:PAS domain-containing hybrid sensor histidine kinase/response regulator [Ignavibacterium album]AFH49948.1 NarL family signal transduction histidine kinase [Ignavibacterium album JCM 16511]